VAETIDEGMANLERCQALSNLPTGLTEIGMSPVQPANWGAVAEVFVDEGSQIVIAGRAQGRLKPRIEIEADWTEIGRVAGQLLDRSFVGKAVLHLS